MKSITAVFATLIGLFYLMIVLDGYNKQQKAMFGFVTVKVQSASWCGPCHAYKPEIERVRYDLADEPVNIEIFEDQELPGNPGYVPWTTIESDTRPDCNKDFVGYKTAVELKSEILAVLECQRN